MRWVVKRDGKIKNGKYWLLTSRESLSGRSYNCFVEYISGEKKEKKRARVRECHKRTVRRNSGIAFISLCDKDQICPKSTNLHWV